MEKWIYRPGIWAPCGWNPLRAGSKRPGRSAWSRPRGSRSTRCWCRRSFGSPRCPVWRARRLRREWFPVPSRRPCCAPRPCGRDAGSGAQPRKGHAQLLLTRFRCRFWARLRPLHGGAACTSPAASAGPSPSDILSSFSPSALTWPCQPEPCAPDQADASQQVSGASLTHTTQILSCQSWISQLSTAWCDFYFTRTWITG